MRLQSARWAMLAAWIFAAGASSAAAQAPPPIGTWASNGGEVLMVTQNGQCWFGVGSQVTTAGPCSWQASSAGGILTIISQQLYRPAPVYFNVVWVNQSTISIQGDVFYRRR
jgi:hypothetical protein